ncbi:hypothetical protein J7L06_03630 [Candidatus Bathyarchaeota archaeon]|nr:hypothetical protein [Candidatus Bathyarchaeota archaeon]RLE63311.1 MAG: hypothetical protein DRJ47_09595 [Thermoprotei archaeon]
MEKKNLLIVEYPDNSSLIYEVPKEVEAVEEITSEVVEYWNIKLRNKDGTYSWIRINSPSRGDEILIRTFSRTLEYKVTRDKIKKDEFTRSWVK